MRPFRGQLKFLGALSALLWIGGCATPDPAPVGDRPVPPLGVPPRTEPAQKPKSPEVSQTRPQPPATSSGAPAASPQQLPEFHTVQKGETVFSIARRYKLNQYELALWNGMDNINALREGQQLRLTAPANAPSRVAVMPLPTTPPIPQGRNLEEPKAPPADPKPEVATPPPAVPQKPEATPAVPAPPPATDSAGKSPLPEAKIERAPDTSIGAPSQGTPPTDNESLQWVWPTSGRITSAFSESTKGLVIAGSLGQPVVASADGMVSYIGNSLRGYGKMVVIKHNKTFLSVYAHNSTILVREGQTVVKGQKIAEMGSSDSEDGNVKLHFEIRRLGRPVDPLKYLPNERPS